MPIQNSENKPVILLFSVLTLCLAVAWSVYALFGAQIITAMHEGRSVAFLNINSELPGEVVVTNFLALTRQFLILLSFLAAISTIIYAFRKQLISFADRLFGSKETNETKEKIFSLLILFSCSLATYFCLIRFSRMLWPTYFEDMMTLGPKGPWTHRILFVSLAKLIKTVFPSISYFRCYAITQIVPIFLTFYFIKKWGELFVARKRAFIAQLLLAAILISTLDYHSFYDIGVVFFYTACLFFLFKGELFNYLIFFAAGFFNHEIIIFLIPVYLTIYFDNPMGKRKVIGFALLQIILYVIIRGTLCFYLPMDALWNTGVIWGNIRLILGRTIPMEHVIMRWALVVSWYAIAALGIKNAPKPLKRCLILLPLIFGMAFLVGNMIEIRLFNSIIPITIGFILSFISSVILKK